jgi:hypothetical protein
LVIVLSIDRCLPAEWVSIWNDYKYGKAGDTFNDKKKEMKIIHPLLKAARDKKIPHPSQTGKFQQKHWVELMESLGLKDTESVAYISAATWLNNHFHRVENTRKHIGFAAGDRPSFQDFVRAHIAGANYAFWQVADEQNKLYEGLAHPAIENMLTSKSNMVGESDPVGPNRVNMHRLDSLKGPLWELFRNRDTLHELFPDGRPVELSRFDMFLAEVKMSQLYYSFSTLWQDILYGHTAFAFKPGSVYFIQRYPDYHRIKTVAEFRREHFIITSMSEARMMLDAFPEEGFWSSYIHFTPENVLSLSPWSTLSEKAQAIARFQPLSAFSQLDDHLKPLLARQNNPSLERTLQSLLDVWTHLSVLAIQIEEYLYTNDEIYDWDALIKLAPQFRCSTLINLLSQCCNLSEANVIAALDLLTWKGRSQQEDLWAQPLVIIEEHYVFPVSAFLTANLTRNINCWIGKIDPKDARRGKMFEKDLLRVLEECKEGNPVMKENMRYTGAVKLKYHGKMEEIDLTFSFGQVLVVAEARSRKTSITPLDYENEMYDDNGLIKKTNQARRKADFVRSNLNEFCQDYYPHLVGEVGVDVIPLVIVNGQFHAGYPLNGVPIIDPALLLHFLKDKEVRLRAKPPYDSHQYGLPLWQNVEEAQARLRDYLASPVLITIYNAMCNESENRSGNLGKEFEDIVTLGYEMNFTDWEQYLSIIKRLFPDQLVRYY